jgi:resolvase-like protein
VLKRLEAGDVLVVTRLDRLARSTRDLLNILDTVAKAGANFKSLGDTWADTTTPKPSGEQRRVATPLRNRGVAPWVDLARTSSVTKAKCLVRGPCQLTHSRCQGYARDRQAR